MSSVTRLTVKGASLVKNLNLIGPADVVIVTVAFDRPSGPGVRSCRGGESVVGALEEEGVRLVDGVFPMDCPIGVPLGVVE
jgi:hypothetical protein